MAMHKEINLLGTLLRACTAMCITNAIVMDHELNLNLKTIFILFHALHLSYLSHGLGDLDPFSQQCTRGLGKVFIAGYLNSHLSTMTAIPGRSLKRGRFGDSVMVVA